jgi:ParB/RepB/Spo0J family partition protein
MSTAPTTTKSKPEQPALIAPPAEAIEKALHAATQQPSAAVKASATEKSTKQEGIAEMAVFVPLGKIVPSPTNPRKTFDQNYIAELAVTIARARVHQSIVLREWTARPEDVQRVMDLGYEPEFNPGDQIFQIILGECRWRASQLANKGTIPAVVRNLSNDEVLEMQLIENLTRKDLDPLDEAEGYQALMTKEKGLTGTEIAQRIGKSPQYVSAMVKLCALAEWGKQILRNGWITPGHAVLIARLGDYSAQERAMYAVFNETWNANHHTVVEAVRRKAEAGAPIMSEKALRVWIADNERCDLSKVPWKLDDPDLVPAAGPCTVCPYRSGSDPALFAEIAGDDKQRCMKPSCFALKKQTHINNERDNARMTNQVLQQISVQEAMAPALPNSNVLKAGQWVLARRGECKQTVRAIFINGGDQEGHTPFVCIDAKCKVHKHPPVVIPLEVKPAHHGDTETRRTAGESDAHVAQPPLAVNGGGTGAAPAMQTMTGRELQGGMKSVHHDDKEERMAAARHKAEAAVNELIVHRVLAAEAASIKTVGADFLRPIAEFFLESNFFDADRVAAGLGLDPHQLYEHDPIEKVKNGKDLAQLARLVWLLMVPDTIDHESDQIKTWAKRNKIDLGKVRKELTARIEKDCFYCGCTDLTPCEGGCKHFDMVGVPLVCNAEACEKQFKKQFGHSIEAHAEEHKPLAQTPVNQKPSTTEASEKQGGKAKSSTTKAAKAAKNNKSKPTGKSAGATKTKAKGQAKPKAKGKR